MIKEISRAADYLQWMATEAGEWMGLDEKHMHMHMHMHMINKNGL